MFLSFNLIGIILSGKSGPAVGAKAPDFAALATTGTTIKLSDFNGSWVVLYFYPKSFTPGCTAESCSLRDSYTDIQEMDAVILGVSVDDIETQQEFKAKYKLQFDLVSDQDKDISRAFNVLGLAGMYAQRKTFIIDPEGKIAYIFDQVKAKEHDAQVKEVLDKLQQTWTEATFSKHKLVFESNFSEAKLNFARFKGKAQFQMRKLCGRRTLGIPYQWNRKSG